MSTCHGGSIVAHAWASGGETCRDRGEFVPDVPVAFHFPCKLHITPVKEGEKSSFRRLFMAALHTMTDLLGQGKPSNLRFRGTA